jgi:hypothetical protein
MTLFDDVFNKSSIYDMLFFNIKAVLIYPTLEEFKIKNKSLFECWKYLSKTKYGFDMDVIHAVAGTMTDETPQYAQKIYEDNAVQYPEFCKIVAITYASLYGEKGTIKRYFKKIVNEDEYIIIGTFMDILHQLSTDDAKSQPSFSSILCGYNIISYDIPFLIKKFFYYKDKFKMNKTLPYILKKSLSLKPWDSGLVDIVNVWKFNGFEYTPLILISEYLGLKKTIDLLPLNELSKYYWNNVGTKPEETLEFVALQSATQTNLVIQLINELRQF